MLMCPLLLNDVRFRTNIMAAIISLEFADHADDQEKKRTLVSISRTRISLPLAPWLALWTSLFNVEPYWPSHRFKALHSSGSC